MYHAATSIGDAESYIAKRAMGQSASATDEFLGYYSPHLREFPSGILERLLAEVPWTQPLRRDGSRLPRKTAWQVREESLTQPFGANKRIVGDAGDGDEFGDQSFAQLHFPVRRGAARGR